MTSVLRQSIEFLSEMFVPLAGVVTIDNSDPMKDVFFDLFPVENGERLTDYPVASFGVDREGNIRGEAPAGTFEVEVFSPDNSYRLDEDLTITIPSDVGSYDVGSIDLIQRSMVSVRGSISDASGNPIWADVLFVNPDDLEEEFWPMWDEAAEKLWKMASLLSAFQRDYLVLAERFDGMYISKF